MGKKTTKENDDGELLSPENPMELQIVEALGEAGIPPDDAIVWVYRYNDKGKTAFVDRFALLDFNVAYIGERYGGGKFRQFTKVGGKIMNNGVFDIEGAPILVVRSPVSQPTQTTPPGAQPAVQPGAQPNGTESQILIFLERVTSRMDKLEEKMTDGAKDKILEALIANMGNNSSGVEDRLIDRLAAFKNLLGGGGGNNSDVGQVFTAVKQVMEIANSAEGGGSPWISIVEKVIPIFQQTVAAYATQRGKRPVDPSKVIPPEEKTDQPSGKPVPPTPPLTGFQAIRSVIEPHIPSLITFASSGHDTEAVANLILPYLPDQNKGEVIEWFKSSGWLNDLATLDQRIPAQAAWWNELKDTLLEFLTTEESPGESEAEEVL